MCRAPNPPVAQILKDLRLADRREADRRRHQFLQGAYWVYNALSKRRSSTLLRSGIFVLDLVRFVLDLVRQNLACRSFRAGVQNDENRHIQLVGQPVTLSRTPSKMAARPPEFGEQTEEVLAEFGFAQGRDRGIAGAQGGMNDRPSVLVMPLRPTGSDTAGSAFAFLLPALFMTYPLRQIWTYCRKILIVSRINASLFAREGG